MARKNREEQRESSGVNLGDTRLLEKKQPILARLLAEVPLETMKKWDDEGRLQPALKQVRSSDGFNAEQLIGLIAEHRDEIGSSSMQAEVRGNVEREDVELRLRTANTHIEAATTDAREAEESIKEWEAQGMPLTPEHKMAWHKNIRESARWASYHAQKAIEGASLNAQQSLAAEQIVRRAAKLSGESPAESARIITEKLSSRS